MELGKYRDDKTCENTLKAVLVALELILNCVAKETNVMTENEKHLLISLKIHTLLVMQILQF